MKSTLFHLYVTSILLLGNVGLLWYVAYREGIVGSFTCGFGKFGVLKSGDLDLEPYTSQFEYEDPLEFLAKYPIEVENATAVFNTIQGALKQKDSNVNPVGVSFIPAYIPANTRLYHSRGNGSLPESFEWTAFSSEFSYSFASFSRKFEAGNGIDTNRRAVLFTFRTKVPLDKIIYLDGASAAKRSPEMDQQGILSNLSDVEGPWKEREAADVICKWGKSFGLQGFIRLEVGFEMVLCDFHKDVELVSNITLPYVSDLIGFPPEESKYVPQGMATNEDSTVLTYGQTEPEYDSLSFNRSLLISHLRGMSSFDWSRSGNSVDSGESRIQLDLTNMITPLNKTYVDPDPYKRNISYISPERKREIIEGLEHVFQTPVDPSHKTDWQSITSTIVKKFGFVLVNLNRTLNSDLPLKEVSDNLQLFTYNTIRRYTHSEVEDIDLQKELMFKEMVQDYVYHSFTLQNSDFLIYSSIAKIHSEIVQLILDSFHLSKAISQDIYVVAGNKTFAKEIQDLSDRFAKSMNTLNWSMFYGCAEACGPNQFCYTPTWGPSPFGWGPIEGEFFNHDEGVFKINHDFKCVSYTDMISVPSLN